MCLNTYILYCTVMLYLKDKNSNISSNRNYNNKLYLHPYVCQTRNSFSSFSPPSLLCLSLLGQSLTVILGMQFTSVRSPYYTVISHTRQHSRKPLTAFGQGSYNFRTFGDFRRVFCTASSVPYLGAMLPTSE